MAYEYRIDQGVVRLVEIRGLWKMEFSRIRFGKWSSADEAAKAVAAGKTGLLQWDSRSYDVSADLSDWTPTGDSL
jgi:hypothetical protein